MQCLLLHGVLVRGLQQIQRNYRHSCEIQFSRQIFIGTSHEKFQKTQILIASLLILFFALLSCNDKIQSQK